MINISKPQLGKEEEQAVINVLRSGKLIQGEQVEAFEKEFAAFSGAKEGVAVENGTSALIVALTAAGVGPGDEVITTPFTFIATANAISFVGAKPVFVDVNAQTFNLDPSRVEEAVTPKTKALLPVHIYGLMADMEKLSTIAKKHSLVIIEDSAQAHGGAIDGKKAGSWGDAATFSFYPSKNMTTGEGGMITTSDEQIAHKARVFRNQGGSKQYEHEMIGFNFRMTEIEAAMGREQLKKLPGFTEKRIANAKFFNEQLAAVKGVTTPVVPSGYTHVYHQYTIKVEKPYPLTRDQLLEKLQNAEIGARVYYPKLLSEEKVYQNAARKDLSTAAAVHDVVLSLPVHAALTQSDLEKIVEVIKNV
jgi:dTDP-4-amino-4,6-dideoxygalactose transaminase